MLGIDWRRSLEEGVVGPLLALPDSALERVVARLGGPPVTRSVPMDLRASLLIHLDRRLHSAFESMTPDEARRDAERRVAVTLGPAPYGVRTEEVRLPHPTRGDGLRVQVHSPIRSDRALTILYFHQGGFIFGRPEWSAPLAGILVGTLGARVLCVDYGLAPQETLVSIQQNALFAARTLVHEHLETEEPWVVAGDSAGGHIAAWLAQKLPDREKPNAQLLIYPFLDASAETHSRTSFAHAHPVSRAFLGWSRAHAIPPGLGLADPDVSPARREALEGLAPALVVTTGFDPLIDEAELYAARLAAAGVHVVERRFWELPHGFTCMAGAVPRAGDAMREIARELQVLLSGLGPGRR